MNNVLPSGALATSDESFPPGYKQRRDRLKCVVSDDNVCLFSVDFVERLAAKVAQIICSDSLRRCNTQVQGKKKGFYYNFLFSR